MNLPFVVVGVWLLVEGLLVKASRCDESTVLQGGYIQDMLSVEVPPCVVAMDAHLKRSVDMLSLGVSYFPSMLSLVCLLQVAVGELLGFLFVGFP